MTARYQQTKSFGVVDTLSATKQAQVVEPAVTTVALTGTVSLSAVGQASQLTLTAILNDGTTADVTSIATWAVSDESVASVLPSGLLVANGLGVTQSR